MSGDNWVQHLIADRYLLLERLGRGGMGTVWRATDQLLRRTVALKEVNLQARVEESAKQVRQVHREARALARVSHPHVVDIYDLITYEGRLWLVMELVDGPSLAEHVTAAGPLAPHQVARIGLQLLAALEAVHAADALHRDVKPANVLLRSDGSAVLCDFGIAALADTESLTAGDVVMGSLAFMAPERLTDKPVGPASDLFSLGATLYALLSGRSPFARQEPAAVVHAVVWQPPAIPEGAGSLRPVLEALLRKDPGSRPSAVDALQMLRAVAEGALPPRRSRPAVMAGSEPRSPIRRWAVLSAALLLVVGAAAGFMARHWSEGSQAGADTGSSGEPSPLASDGPTSVDAVMPAPDDDNRYWLFSGGWYIRIFTSASSPFGKQEIRPTLITNWRGAFEKSPPFSSRIDAAIRVPNSPGEYWVFSGDQYKRIYIKDKNYYDSQVFAPRPLSDWSDVLGRLDTCDDGIDAVMPVPDTPQQFWVFCKDQYIRVELDGEGPDGHDVDGPFELSDWFGPLAKYPAFRTIDATMQVPDSPNEYWVFSGSYYIKIHVTSGGSVTLRPGPERLPNWNDLE